MCGVPAASGSCFPLGLRRWMCCLRSAPSGRGKRSNSQGIELEPLKEREQPRGFRALEDRVVTRNWGSGWERRVPAGRVGIRWDQGWFREGPGVAARCSGPSASSDPCASVPPLPARDTSLRPNWACGTLSGPGTRMGSALRFRLVYGKETGFFFLVTYMASTSRLALYCRVRTTGREKLENVGNRVRLHFSPFIGYHYFWQNRFWCL